YIGFAGAEGAEEGAELVSRHLRAAAELVGIHDIELAPAHLDDAGAPPIGEDGIDRAAAGADQRGEAGLAGHALTSHHEDLARQPALEVEQGRGFDAAGVMANGAGEVERDRGADARVGPYQVLEA